MRLNSKERTLDWGPGYDGYWNPDDVCVAIQGPALEEISGFASEPLQSSPEGDRDESCGMSESHFGLCVWELPILPVYP